VRSVGKRIADICRHAALQIALKPEMKVLPITKKDLFDILGPERYDFGKTRTRLTAGVVTGLAWTPFGGDILPIEVCTMPGKGDLKITGNLGDVMKESAQAAWSVCRQIEALKVAEYMGTGRDIHLHVPAGAIPKEGPSAGITITVAIASSILKIPVPNTVAMSGEITITGDILPVGGVREKVIAAHGAGIKTIYLPASCEKDMYEVPENVKKDLEIFYVSHAREVLSKLFDLTVD